MGETTAKMNIADLHKVLNIPECTILDEASNSKSNCTTPVSESLPSQRRFQKVRRESMEQLDLIKVVLINFWSIDLVNITM